MIPRPTELLLKTNILAFNKRGKLGHELNINELKKTSK